VEPLCKHDGYDGLPPTSVLRDAAKNISELGNEATTADSAALSEVMDGSGTRFDPKASKDLAHKILVFINQPELLNRKLLEQQERIGRFSWESTARAY
jgi:hypothetical protein